MKNNLELWESVQETNPKYTKKAKVGGNSITAISPQFQIMNATEKFGVYGKDWGFKDIVLDYSLTNIPIIKPVLDYYTKKTEDINTILGLVTFKALFFHPSGQFEIINSINIFTDNKHSKIDDDFAKKLETDTITKALSKLGFNADIFLGKFDDVRYLEEMKEKYKEPKKKAKLTEEGFNYLMDKGTTEEINKAISTRNISKEYMKELVDKLTIMENR